MPSAMTTSKAERRSVATTKSRLPDTSYTSRTLPREKSFTPVNRVSRRGGCSVKFFIGLLRAPILKHRDRMSTKKTGDIFRETPTVWCVVQIKWRKIWDESFAGHALRWPGALK